VKIYKLVFTHRELRLEPSAHSRNEDYCAKNVLFTCKEAFHEGLILYYKAATLVIERSTFKLDTTAIARNITQHTLRNVIKHLNIHVAQGWTPSDWKNVDYDVEDDSVLVTHEFLQNVGELLLSMTAIQTIKLENSIALDGIKPEEFKEYKTWFGRCSTLESITFCSKNFGCLAGRCDSLIAKFLRNKNQRGDFFYNHFPAIDNTENSRKVTMTRRVVKQ